MLRNAQIGHYNDGDRANLVGDCSVLSYGFVSVLPQQLRNHPSLAEVLSSLLVNHPTFLQG